jgi:hypothetical protein
MPEHCKQHTCFGQPYASKLLLCCHMRKREWVFCRPSAQGTHVTCDDSVTYACNNIRRSYHVSSHASSNTSCAHGCAVQTYQALTTSSAVVNTLGVRCRSVVVKHYGFRALAAAAAVLLGCSAATVRPACCQAAAAARSLFIAACVQQTVDMNTRGVDAMA